MRRFIVSLTALYWILVVKVGDRTEYYQRGFPSHADCARTGQRMALRLVVRPGTPEVSWTCTPEAGDRK